MGQPVDQSLSVARARSAIARLADAVVGAFAPRVNQYRDQYVMPVFNGSQVSADEGSYFVAGSAAIQGAGTITIQPGTGLATIATPTAFADTSPFVLVKNNNQAGGARIILDYIKLKTTAAGTAGTSIRWLSALDSANPLRYTSGGSQLVPTNVNQDDATASGALILAGPLVAIARNAGARAPFGNILCKNAIGAAGDSFLIRFASPDGQNTLPAAVGMEVHPPVVIGPQQIYTGHLVIPSQSAASSYEIEIGYIER